MFLSTWRHRGVQGHSRNLEMVTPLKVNSFAPENGGTGRLYTFLLGPKVTFQGRAVKLREGMVLASLQDIFVFRKIGLGCLLELGGGSFSCFLGRVKDLRVGIA